MPYPIAAQADDELALLQYLRTITTVTALVPVANVIQELPPSPTYPYVLIQRAGGDQVAPDIDDAAIQVDVLAETRGAAKRLALAVRAAILAIANDQVPEAVLCSAAQEIGPQWLPDTVPTPPQPRYTARYSIILHK
jgi:hypothetical protein